MRARLERAGGAGEEAGARRLLPQRAEGAGAGDRDRRGDGDRRHAAGDRDDGHGRSGDDDRRADGDGRAKDHDDRHGIARPSPARPVDDVKALHDAGALFLDARRTSVYEQGHIAGARPFSVWESDIDDKVRKLFDERGDPAQQAQPIVIYCSGGECEDSHMLAQKLWGIQFNNVYVYKDGYPDWVAHRGAAHTGSNP